jgi:DNA-binding NtrC family response regulator
MYDSNILYSEAVREFKKTFIVHVLEQHRGNQCKAARQLGMHRNTLSRTLTELGLDVKEIRRHSTDRRPPRSVQVTQDAAMEKKAAR